MLPEGIEFKLFVVRGTESDAVATTGAVWEQGANHKLSSRRPGMFVKEVRPKF